MTPTHLRRAGALALIAATTTALTGCAGVLGARMTYHDTEPTKITEITLTGGSGDVIVRTAAVDQTTITRVVRYGGNPGVSYRVAGTVLQLDTSCGPDCTVSYEILAPVGVAVRGSLNSGDVQLDGVGATDVTLTSGDIAVRNASGAVRARSTSGDIDVLDATGAVTAQSTSGDVRAVNAGGAVEARTTSGDVEVRLATANSVTAKAGSGNVSVTVPPGSYRIAAGTRSGDDEVRGLTNDPSAKYTIDVETGSGDVDIAAV